MGPIMHLARKTFAVSATALLVGFARSRTEATIIGSGDLSPPGLIGTHGDTTAPDVAVGDTGTGILKINGGSVLTTSNPSPEAHIASETGSTETVTVTAASRTVVGQGGCPGRPF